MSCLCVVALAAAVGAALGLVALLVAAETFDGGLVSL